MSARDLLDELMKGEAAPELELAAMLWRAGRREAEERAEDLAEGELLDGLHFDDERARAESQDEAAGLRLAAAPAEVGAARVWSSGEWRVRWGTRTDGGATVLLLGPAPAELLLGPISVPLQPQEWTPVDVPAPPRTLALRLGDGRVIVLG